MSKITPNFRQLIAQASDPANALAVRHSAFTELVKLFQDMVYGYAFSILGDSHSAEDIAQETFLLAWQQLDSLREPSAFAGWLRRITLTQCLRITRTQQLLIVSLTDEIEFLSDSPEPQFVAESSELKQQIWSAIQSLPENERIPVVLHYISGYPQKEIAAYLGLPLTTIKKRLSNARARMRKGMITMIEELKQQTPSDEFAERIGKIIAAIENGQGEQLFQVIEQDQNPEELLAELKRRGHLQQFTASTRHVIIAGQQVAAQKDDSYLQPEHLLQALYNGNFGIATQVLCEAGVTVEEIELLMPSAETDGKAEGEPQNSPETHRVLQFAACEAKELAEQLSISANIEPEHLLLGIIGLESKPLRELLNRYGLDLISVRTGIKELLTKKDFPAN